MKFDSQGRQTKQTAFDNGTTTWSYESAKNGARLKTVMLANDEQIDYSWHGTKESKQTDISMGPARVRIQSDGEGRMAAMTWGRRLGNEKEAALR